MKTRALVVALAMAGTALAAPAAAQESGTFTLSQNGTEVASEEFTRTGDVLETAMTIPGRALIQSEATLADDAAVARIEIRVFPPGQPDAPPLQTTAAEFGDDSVHVEQPIGTDMGGQPAPLGTVPFLNPSPAHLEQMLMRALAQGGGEQTVEIWMPAQGAGQVAPAQVAFGEEGTATITLGTVSFEIETDDEGRLLGAEVPSQGLVIERQ